MYYGGGAQSVNNPNNTAVPYPFVTAYLRGRTDGFMLKGGDATTGTLTTMFDGARPFVINGSNTQNRHYQPSNKQGGALVDSRPLFSLCPPLHSFPPPLTPCPPSPHTQPSSLQQVVTTPTARRALFMKAT